MIRFRRAAVRRVLQAVSLRPAVTFKHQALYDSLFSAANTYLLAQKFGGPRKGAMGIIAAQRSDAATAAARLQVLLASPDVAHLLTPEMHALHSTGVFDRLRTALSAEEPALSYSIGSAIAKHLGSDSAKNMMCKKLLNAYRQHYGVAPSYRSPTLKWLDTDEEAGDDTIYVLQDGSQRKSQDTLIPPPKPVTLPPAGHAIDFVRAAMREVLDAVGQQNVPELSAGSIANVIASTNP